MRNFKIVSLVLFVSLFSFSAFGQKAYIISEQDGLWFEQSTWKGGVVPTASDDVIIRNDVIIMIAEPTVNTIAVISELIVINPLISTNGIIVYGTGTLIWSAPSSSCPSGGIEIRNGSTTSSFSEDIDCTTAFTVKTGAAVEVKGNVTCNACEVILEGGLTTTGNFSIDNGLTISGSDGFIKADTNKTLSVGGNILIESGSDESEFAGDIDCTGLFTIEEGAKATIMDFDTDCSASEVVVEGELATTGSFSIDNDLTISDDGFVTVASSETLSVGGDLDINNAKTDKIVLNGSLSVTGSTTCEIAFPADRFTSFCPPMSNSTANQMIDPGGDDVFLTYWTPGANSSTAYNYITSLSTALTNQGYMFWPDNNAGLTVDFSGNLRVASGTSFSYSASWGAGGTEDGYNFIGNPFPCHIDINDFTFNNIYSSTVYIWNGSSFLARNGSSEPANIAPFQGFFVQATGNSASVAFNESAAMASTSSFLKSDTEKSDFRRLHIEIEGNGYAQEFYLFVSENATMGHDDTYDVHSFFGLDVVPYLYTVPEYDLEPHCFYGVPELSDGDDDYQIPLTVQTGAATEYGFFFTGMEDFSSDYRLFLYDILLDKKINLYEQNTYVCDLETGVTSDRFILILEKDLVSVEEIDDEKFGTVFVQNSDLIVSLEDNRSGKISVFDMMGKCVAEQNVTGKQTIISMGNKKGCFVVNVVMKDGGITEKVVIK